MFQRLRRRRPAEDDRFAILDLIAEFVECDSQDCALDATGECRPHGYPTVEAGLPCPYTRARAILDAYRPLLEARQAERAAAARRGLAALTGDPELIEWAAQGAMPPRPRKRSGRPPKGGYLAANVTVSEMGPLPDTLTRPGIGHRPEDRP